MTSASAAAVFGLAFLPIVGLTIILQTDWLDLWPGIAIFAAVSIALGLVGSYGARPVPRGREIRLRQVWIEQLAPDGTVAASIDASREYQYRLEWVGSANDAIIRLYQGDVRIELYLSDPGAEEIRARALRFAWPRPPMVDLTPPKHPPAWPANGASMLAALHPSIPTAFLSPILIMRSHHQAALRPAT